MKTKISFLIAAIMVVSSFNCFAQRKADYVTKYDDNIQQILLNQLNGHIIVKEKNVISDYNPETKQTEWKINKDEIVKVGTVESMQKVLNSMASIPDLVNSFQSTDQISFVPGSPFVRAVIENRDIIINSFNGKVVFNSGATNYRILSTQFLLEDESLLFLASDGKNFNYILWNLKTGNESWKSQLGTVAGLMGALKDALSLRATTPSEDKAIAAKDAIYTTVNGILYKLDKTTGKIAWQSKDKINTFHLSQSGKDVVVIKNSGGMLSTKQALNIWSTADGKPVWSDDIKTKFIIYLEDWNDKLLVVCNNGFNFYNYADGKKVWKKDAKGDNIKQVIPIGEEDYLYIADKEMNLIDVNGVNKWKKFIEISEDTEEPVYFLDKIGGDMVVYLTASHGNIVDYKTGKKIWKKTIDFQKDVPVLYAFDEETQSFMVYNDKKVYKFDDKTVEKPEPIAKLKGVNDDETITNLELFDWGISLVGQGDVIGVGMDGVTKYHNKYKEPGGGKRKWLQAGTLVGSVGLTTVGVVSGLKFAAGATANTFGIRDESGKLLRSDRQLKKDLLIANTSLLGAELLAQQYGKVEKRFNAMKHNNEYAFIFAKGENGETTQLVKVRKTDGEEVDKIAIDNTKPIYEVDPVNDNVYYVYKNELRVFGNK